MPHVAEGELHAWLDGALEETAPERVADVVGHLRVCGDCRARLEQARELRERAAELLEATAPEPGSLPPVETLLARAGSDSPPAAPGGEGSGRRRARLFPPLRTLAWAASLLVGVGLGWGARTAWRPAAEERLAAADEPGPPPAAEPAAGGEGRAPRVSAARADAAGAKAGEQVWIRADPEDAARWLGGGLLVVEGLPVVDAAVSTSRAVRVVRVRQRLPSGDLLELHQRPAGTELEEPSAEPSGAATVVEGFEVRLRAPVAPDSLRVLLSGLTRRRP